MTLSARWCKFAGTALLCAALLCAAACQAGPSPAEGEAVVWYRNQDVVMPMTLGGVTRVRAYHVHGELYQLVVDQQDALTPQVFTPFEIVRYEAGEGVPVETYEDRVYHTYDPFLQQTKSELRKAFIYDAYETYFGREPSEAEFNEELEKLIEKVQLEDLEARISTAPEAVIRRIEQQRGEALDEGGIRRVKRMLARGVTADEIVEAFVA